jgi:SAM-dependent methyltransferase
MAQNPSLTTAIPAELAEDHDSTFGDIESSTASLRSSIYEHVYENGRRYHSFRAGQYVLPNDEAEQERLDVTHHLFTLTLKGNLCITKLENPQNILDIGTGTGIWAIDIGDQYPTASVIGTDLSPIQPPWVPPNVRFEIDDCTDDWTFPLSHFDFIHIRTLGGSIKDWPALLKRCYDHLKPGGHVEVVEGRTNFWTNDNTFPPDSAFKQWLDGFHEYCTAAGIDFDVIPQVPGWLEKVGFTGIQTLDCPVPVGTWPKDPALKKIGAVFRTHQYMAFEAYAVALFTRVGGWSADDFQILIAKAREEMATNKLHIYTFT